MMRIVALNEDSNSHNSEDIEPQVTKEAEETIAVSEYMRALGLKQKGQTDDALYLFLQLLDTQVLSEVSEENKDDKLFSVKYNCHRNIGFIYEEKGEKLKALEHLISALELDETDVYTNNRMGQLALSINRLEIARIAFQKCLTCNPNHWPSADGLLQVLCLTENIIEAYGWALHLHKKDEDYERAIDVLTEITERFELLIPFFENTWGGSFKIDKPLHIDRKNKKSCFPESSISTKTENISREKPDLSQYRVMEFTWLSVGDLIINLYELLNQDIDNFCNILTWNDLKYTEEVQINCSTDAENSKIEENKDLLDESTNTAIEVQELNTVNSQPENNTELEEKTACEVVETTPDDSSSQPKTDEINTTSTVDKPKKRRGSDLSFLEQWGWHKNRRSSRKKSTQEPTEQEDTTISGYIKRILAKYFVENFDTNESPFKDDTQNNAKSEINEKYKPKIVHFKTPPTSKEDDFQKRTKDDFITFMDELKKFDIIHLLYKWLEYISQYWDQVIPPQICDQYLKIYKYYLNHYELNTWNLLEWKNFKAVYRMTLFYLEQDHERILTRKLNKDEINGVYRKLLYQVMFHYGYHYVTADDDYLKFATRLFWINYCVGKLENNLEVAIDYIYKIEELLEKHDTLFILKLPNNSIDNHIDMVTVQSLISSLQRTISLNNVGNLYSANKYEDLATILKDSLINCTEIKNSDNTTMKIQTQFEVLLESLWNLEDFEDCFKWSEKCLKYAVDNFLIMPDHLYRQKEWADVINFILIYLEALIQQESSQIFLCLDKYLSRLIQSIRKIIAHQLDSPFDKNNTIVHSVNFKIPWVILYHLILREEDSQSSLNKKLSKETSENSENEDVEESMPNSILIFFTAHEFLGRRYWCAKDNGQLLFFILDVVGPKLRSPLLEPFRDIITEKMEQVTYCLYAYPAKRARLRHIEEHDAAQIELTWERAVQLFDLYRPDNLPEFDSYKLDSITAEMEQLLQRILALTPKQLDLTCVSNAIKLFIQGTTSELPEQSYLFPSRMATIFYLLADYYFKNRDFLKTIKYYILDLTINPSRFDSWAGLALSKATKLETKLNSCAAFNSKEFLIQSEEALRCFEECIKLKDRHTLVWIEYGSFAYTLHSFCSRNLKQSSETMSMEGFAFVEDRKDECMKIAYNCFHTIDMYMNNEKGDKSPKKDSDEAHDEKWLYHYMLGKIAEKKKDTPSNYLDHYLQASKYLYESNAIYPIKISHSNPQNLSIEALELYYRITSAIIKYLEQHTVVPRAIGKLFTKVLKELSTSPFAYNQAKLDDNSINALKRKMEAAANEESAKQSRIEESNQNIESETPILSPIIGTNNEAVIGIDINTGENKTEEDKLIENDTPIITPVNELLSVETNQKSEIDKKDEEKPLPTSPNRRSSQESTATSTTTTGTNTGTTGTSSSSSSSSSSESGSSDSSSSDSDSGSSSDDENKMDVDDDTPLNENELETIYKNCVKNFEECLARFPEHYKSVHRLVYHYLHAPKKLRDLERAQQLLLGTYRTTLGNEIQGLFSDRKVNNFFNGIWRIPSPEIDRPGSFASHLSKCVIVLMEVLKEIGDHKILFELALQLQRSPEAEKKYIKDTERKELFQQAMSFCSQSLRNLLKKHGTDARNDTELLTLLIDIYKTHRKCIKHMLQKETLFSALLIDTYKCYIQDKVAKIPDNVNLLDLAIKMCLHEMNSRKTADKQNIQGQATGISGIGMIESVPINLPKSTGGTTATVSVTPPSKPPVIPGISRPRGRPVGSKNSPNTAAMMVNPFLDSVNLPNMLAMYSNPFTAAQLSDPASVNALLAEYYKLALGSPSFSPLTNSPTSLLSGMSGNLMGNMKQQQPVSSTVTSTPMPSPKSIPQFDMKNLIASAANLVASSGTSSSSTINLGGGQLTITPTPPAKSNTSKESNKFTITTSSKDIVNKSYEMASMSLSGYNKNTSPSASATTSPLSSSRSYAQEVLASVASKMPSVSSLLTLPQDLPKSLTITPTPSVAESNQKKQQQKPNELSIKLQKEVLIPQSAAPSKQSNKAKTSLKKSQKTAHPYSRQSSATAAALSQLSQITSLHPQFPGMIPSLNTADYNQQLMMLKSYTDSYMKYMTFPPGSAFLSNTAPMQQTQRSAKKSYNKKQQQQQQQQQHQQIKTSLPSPSSSASGKHLPQTSTTVSGYGKSLLKQHQNMGNFVMPQLPTSPALSRSPAKSPQLSGNSATSTGNLSRASLTPPSISSQQHQQQASPTKTLQQKLVERQKASASMNENKGGNKSGNINTPGGRVKMLPDDDVIVLE